MYHSVLLAINVRVAVMTALIRDTCIKLLDYLPKVMHFVKLYLKY